MPISRLIASCEELGVDPEALERLFTAAEEEVTSGKARSPPRPRLGPLLGQLCLGWAAGPALVD